MRYLRYLMIAVAVAMFTLLGLAVANATNPKHLEGTEVSIVYMCISPVAFEDIFSQKTAEALNETSEAYESGGSCYALPYSIEVELVEYIGYATVADPEGTAYIYRTVGGMYTFLFKATQGV